MINEHQLENWFTHHPPTRRVPDPDNPGGVIVETDIEAVQAYQSIREAGLAMSKTILRFTPACPDQSAAVRKIREAVMTANAAIACGGR